MLSITRPLILASASPVRQHMLEKIGLPFKAITSRFDEEAAKPSIRHLSLPEQALALAKGKAKIVSEQYPTHLVIGADQIGEADSGALFKPLSAAGNINMLKQLQGKSHDQHTAACLYLNGECLASFVDSTRLDMRPLTEKEISHYVHSDKPWHCCGGYRYEGLGRSLFTGIDGSVDTILGLPLAAIVNYLFDQGYIKLK